MQEVRPGFFVSNKCKGCLAVDRAGKSLREVIDLRKDKGEPTLKITAFLQGEGYLVSQPNLDKHFRKHSPWIFEKHTELKRAEVKTDLVSKQIEHRNAEDEIQRLIDIGAQRIDNEEILVDKEMYLFALDRKTRNQTPISVQNLVMNFGQALTENLSEEPLKVIESHEIT